MKKRGVSSHDVARAAGVSQSTVSLVLNGRLDARISEATRQRVLDAASELNYSRNAAARALVTGRTNRIGILLNHPNSFRSRSHYHSEILAGVLDGALRWNYNLLFHTSVYPDWRALYSDILSGSADGVLLIGDYPDAELAPALIESQFPTVFVSHYPEHQPHYAVDCDNECGGYLAAQHLLALGHRHLVFLYDAVTGWQQERQAGVQRAVAEVGDNRVQLDVVYFESEEGARNYLLNATSRPTGAILAGEGPGPYLVEELPKHGLRVPDDLALINFNSTLVCEKAAVPLTSVWQPLSDIGEAAVDMLVALLEGREIPSGVRRFPVRLDIRQSCGADKS